uniref:THAP domain-containing protein 1 n=1 Tax=Pygocentrus nattereri TaxID=42514 RepID=A0A3B4DYX8_PYGNA
MPRPNFSGTCCRHQIQNDEYFLSFHSFPARSDLRSQWLINIRRDQFTVSPHTKVCSRHFIPDHLIEPKTPEGRRRLTKDAVPLLFERNGYSIQAPRLSVWERRQRPADPTSLEDPSADLTVDHDYCSAPEPSSLDMSCAENEDLSREVEELRNQLHELHVQLTFGLQRFSGSDEDIRFYTSAVSDYLTLTLTLTLNPNSKPNPNSNPNPKSNSNPNPNPKSNRNSNPILLPAQLK